MVGHANNSELHPDTILKNYTRNFDDKNLHISRQ
jgi:hypothetical protein